MKILDLDAELKTGQSAPKSKKKVPKLPDEKLPPEPPRSRTPLLLGGLALFLVVGAVAWIIVRNWPERIRFGLDAVGAVVEEEFPATGRYLSLVDATVSNPRVGTAATSDRIGMIFDLSLAPAENGAKWSGEEKTGRLELSTRIEVTAGLRYEPPTRRVYLDDPVIERMDLSGTPPDFQNRAHPFITKVIESALNTRPVYTVKVTDIKARPDPLRMKSFAVENGEVVIVLKP